MTLTWNYKNWGREVRSIKALFIVYWKRKGRGKKGKKGKEAWEGFGKERRRKIGNGKEMADMGKGLENGWKGRNGLGPPKPKDLATSLEITLHIFVRRGLLRNQYADDMQTVGHCSLCSVRNIASTLRDSIADVRQWRSTKRLQLNAEKDWGHVIRLNNSTGCALTTNAWRSDKQPSSRRTTRVMDFLLDAELSMHDNVAYGECTCTPFDDSLAVTSRRISQWRSFRLDSIIAMHSSQGRLPRRRVHRNE